MTEKGGEFSVDFGGLNRSIHFFCGKTQPFLADEIPQLSMTNVKFRSGEITCFSALQKVKLVKLIEIVRFGNDFLLCDSTNPIIKCEMDILAGNSELFGNISPF